MSQRGKVKRVEEVLVSNMGKWMTLDEIRTIANSEKNVRHSISNNSQLAMFIVSLRKKYIIEKKTSCPVVEQGFQITMSQYRCVSGKL